MGRQDRPFYFLAFFLILIIALIGYTLYYQLENEQNLVKQKELELFTSQYAASIDGYRNLSEAYIRQILTEDVLELFARGTAAENTAERDVYRRKLYAELEPFYRELRDIGFRQLHFHTTDSRSFLRMHRPETYGDDLSDVRVSVVLANQQKTEVSGFEEGSIYNGYRFVHPVFYENRIIGTVELSISIKAVIEQLRERYPNSGKHYQFAFSRSIMEEKVFPEEQENYYDWCLSSDFVLDAGVNPSCILHNIFSENELKRLQEAVAEVSDSMQPYSCIADKEDGQHYIFSAQPILNISGQTAAVFLSLGDSAELKNLDRTYRLVFFAYIVFSLLLAAAVISVWINRRKIEKLATYDHLTGLYNRIVIDEFLANSLYRFRRYGTQTSLVMLDIDYFKQINDTFGHKVGDLVLVTLSEKMKFMIRKSDLAVRWGGEEFLLVLPDTGREDAAVLAERMRAAIEAMQITELKGELVTASFGVVEMGQRHQTPDSAVIEADSLMYRAKDSGRNCVCTAE